jgi:hypothetical protein
MILGGGLAPDVKSLEDARMAEFFLRRSNFAAFFRSAFVDFDDADEVPDDFRSTRPKDHHL